MDRRTFLHTAALTTLAHRAVAASDKVSIAVIGIRGRGRALAAQFAALPDCHVAALCDVDPRVYDRTAQAVEKASGRRPPLVADIRRVLDDKTIDAIVIATPDHWHAPATILACAADKDVYVEKPASHNLREGRLMVEAARRHRRIVQLGTQSRSRPSTRRGIEFVQSGKIGRVLAAKAWNTQLRENIGHQEDSPVPPGVDYDTWTGPAPLLPFNENRFHYKWHWNWNYGTGDMGNDGVHQLDIARWALGADRPIAVSGMGRKLFFDDDQHTPDTMNITFQFPSQVLQFEMRIWNPYGMEGQDNGVAVYGTSGMVHIGRWKGKWGFKVFDDKGELVVDDSKGDGEGAESTHARNFLECVKSRQAPRAEIETGHASTTLCHLGNIVARTGRNLRFNPASETVEADEEAGRLLTRVYRRHWSAPA